MKRILKICCCLTLLMVLFASIASAGGSKDAKLAKKKVEIEQKVSVALYNLYTKEEDAQYQVQNSDGYAVFVSSGFKLGFFGSSHGRGMAVNNVTGEKTYMRMGEYSGGLGIGAKEYDIIFIFKSQDAINNFVNSGWKFNGEAEAAAKDSGEGSQIGGAINLGGDMYMYQLTKKGITAEIGIKGTEYYIDKDFYPEIYGKK